MKSAKDRVVWCNRGHMPLHYGFCPSEKAWKREMARLKISPVPPYPATHGSCTHLENTKGHKELCLVTVSAERRTGVEKVGIIFHEAVHVWQALRRTIGEREPSVEFEAYTVQSIGQELCEAFEMTRGRICHRRVR